MPIKHLVGGRCCSCGRITDCIEFDFSFGEGGPRRSFSVCLEELLETMPTIVASEHRDAQTTIEGWEVTDTKLGFIQEILTELIKLISDRGFGMNQIEAIIAQIMPIESEDENVHGIWAYLNDWLTDYRSHNGEFDPENHSGIEGKFELENLDQGSIAGMVALLIFVMLESIANQPQITGVIKI